MVQELKPRSVTATVRFKTWAPLPMSKTHLNTHTDADTWKEARIN